MKGLMERATVNEEQLTSVLDTLSSLHRTLLSPSSPSHIPLTPDPTPSITATLSPALSPAQKWACLRDSCLVKKLYLQVYQVLEETYYPQYCQSEQVGPIPIPTCLLHSHKRTGRSHSHSHMFPFPHTPFPHVSILHCLTEYL